jgi:hydroxymethylpyrimidine/phosphomethylpyrimidine kinase
MKTLLTVAGFDPSSGAGVTADLQVFSAHGFFGTSCVTALTVQSTLGVRSISPIHPQITADTLACLDADLPPIGIKIGMLATAATVEIVCEYLEQRRSRTQQDPSLIVVLDPVLRSSSGRELLDPPGLELLRDRLLPLVDWITPNLDELALLAGTTVAQRDDLPSAAKNLQARTPRFVPGSAPLGIIATGGHLDPPDDFILTSAGEQAWLLGERVVTAATHGTGCGFSSAFLCHLALGSSPIESARAAKRYVTQAMRSANAIGHGRGPMNLLWPLRP